MKIYITLFALIITATINAQKPAPSTDLVITAEVCGSTTRSTELR